MAAQNVTFVSMYFIYHVAVAFLHDIIKPDSSSQRPGMTFRLYEIFIFPIFVRFHSTETSRYVVTCEILSLVAHPSFYRFIPLTISSVEEHKPEHP